MAKAIFIVNDTVRLRQENVAENDFHYGQLDDPEILGSDTATVIKAEYDKHAKQMSYEIEFDNLQVDNRHWFLESELY